MADDYRSDWLSISRAGVQYDKPIRGLKDPIRCRRDAALDIARGALEAVARRCGDEGDVVIALEAIRKIETLDRNER